MAPLVTAIREPQRGGSQAFVSDLARGLETGGQLRVATDVADYFREIVEMLSHSRLFEPLDLPAGTWMAEDEPLTSYEAKYVVRGRTPLRVAFRRGARPAPPAEPWVSRKPHGAPLGERLLLPKLGDG